MHTTPTPQAVGTVQVSITADITPAWPTHVAGDIALLFVANHNQPHALTTANGFTFITSFGTGTAGAAAATSIGVYWCRATSAAMSAPVVTWTTPGAHLAQIVTFRNCVESGDPWDVFSGDTATADTTVTIPSVVTNTDNCLLVAAVSNRTDDATDQTDIWASTSLGTVTEMTDENTASGNGGGFGVATVAKNAQGTTGTIGATLANSSIQARLILALKPRTAPVYVGAGTAVAAGGTHQEEGQTVAWPTHEAGDIGLLVVECANDATQVAFDDIAGFVEVEGSPVAVGSAYTDSTVLKVFWKRATTSSEGAVTVTWPNQTPGAGYDHWLCQIFAFRACVTSGNPWNTTTSDTLGSAATAMTIPAISPTANYQMIVAICSNDDDIAVNDINNLAGAGLLQFTLRDTSNTSFGKGGGFILATGVLAAAGSSGTITGTWDLPGLQSRFVISLAGAYPIAVSQPATTFKRLGGTTILQQRRPVKSPDVQSMIEERKRALRQR